MRTCHWLAVPALLLLLITGPALANTADDAAAEKERKKQIKEAQRYWKRSNFNPKKVTNNRVAIVEFTVDYIVERQQQSKNHGINLGLVAKVAGVGRREYDFEEQLRAELPDEIYARFVEALQAEGYQVLPMATVAASPAMDEISEGKAGAKKGGGGYYHGFVGGKGSQKVRIYPVNGLPRIKDGLFSAGKNAQAVAKVMADLDADLALRVHMRVGLNKGHATTEAGSNISIYGGVHETHMPGGKPVYYAKTNGSLTTKRGLASEHPVIDSKSFEAFKGNVYTVNSQQYRTAILELAGTYSKYAAMVLAK